MDERRVLEKGLLCSGGNTAKGVAHAKEGGGGKGRTFSVTG